MTETRHYSANSDDFLDLHCASTEFLQTPLNAGDRFTYSQMLQTSRVIEEMSQNGYHCIPDGASTLRVIRIYPKFKRGGWVACIIPGSSTLGYVTGVAGDMIRVKFFDRHGNPSGKTEAMFKAAMVPIKKPDFPLRMEVYKIPIDRPDLPPPGAGKQWYAMEPDHMAGIYTSDGKHLREWLKANSEVVNNPIDVLTMGRIDDR